MKKIFMNQYVMVLNVAFKQCFAEKMDERKGKMDREKEQLSI